MVERTLSISTSFAVASLFADKIYWIKTEILKNVNTINVKLAIFIVTNWTLKMWQYITGKKGKSFNTTSLFSF